MLYHSLILSRIQYGILIWGNAAKIHLRELSVRMNNIIRTIRGAKTRGDGGIYPPNNLTVFPQ